MSKRFVRNGQRKEEAEKPFWISFADLMTALMVLFLVVMAVSLLAVTKKVDEAEKAETKHKATIDACMGEAALAVNNYPGVHIDLERKVIDFGDRARFSLGSYAINADQVLILRQFVPTLLEMTNTPSCQAVLKRIIIEGYTDRTGTYLGNLNLSLMRSQSVLCAMFATKGDFLLTDAQKNQVRDLFLVGGFAFNASKQTAEESRRVEMRLEFLGLGEEKRVVNDLQTDFGKCAI